MHSKVDCWLLPWHTLNHSSHWKCLLNPCILLTWQRNARYIMHHNSLRLVISREDFANFQQFVHTWTRNRSCMLNKQKHVTNFDWLSSRVENGGRLVEDTVIVAGLDVHYVGADCETPERMRLGMVWARPCVKSNDFTPCEVKRRTGFDNLPNSSFTLCWWVMAFWIIFSRHRPKSLG